jgi:DNA relaxase NicK
MKGYRGWHSPHVRMGSRPGGVLLSLSAQKSGDNWRDAFAAAENCSRLDLAVDVRSDPPVNAIALDIYRQMGHRPLRNGRPSSSRLILGSDGGSTVYIGSRQSDFFGRVYDKGVEQQTHRRSEWWRWELEVKGRSAKVLAHQVSSVDVESVAIGCIVAGWFRRRCGLAFPFSEDLALCKWEPESTTVDKKLHWLSSQVRPTVIELLRRGESERLWASLDLPLTKPQLNVPTS